MIFAQSVNRALRQAVASAETFDIAASNPAESVLRASPHNVMNARRQAANPVVGQTLGAREALLAALIEADQSMSRTRPQNAVRSRKQRSNRAGTWQRLQGM